MDQLDADLFANAFSTSLPLPAVIDSTLKDALRYVLDTPGSLIRLKLVYQMAAEYELAADSAEKLAVALEYFHTASLLFDDLPCMDNALERRGAACTHLVFGDDGAILVALALINRAYALTWRVVARCSNDRSLRAIAFIEECLGVEGLLNGQSLDLHYKNLPHTQQTTEHIARGKTVSMIRLTLVLPAMLGDATARELQELERISLFWGLAYQILDDLRDVLQNAKQSGKTPTRDETLGHPNIALVLGVNVAVSRLTRFIRLGDRALYQLLTIRPGLAFLEDLRKSLEEELARVIRPTFVIVKDR